MKAWIPSHTSCKGILGALFKKMTMTDTVQIQDHTMVAITLPDGQIRSFPCPVTGADIAVAISPSLGKAALAICVDGEMWDLTRSIDHDAQVQILTAGSDRALELLRHDAAHIMAQAVQELYPGTQVTIGPAIENGFYYDFARSEPFSSDDLHAIEARMYDIVDRDLKIVREVWDRNKAIEYFQSCGEAYKAEIIRDLPSGEVVTVYRQGDWLDLCRGPHLPSTGRLGKAFRLMKVAGAYWRGDSRNEMLQRIYGTAWATPKQLDGYLHMLEEAEKRDHRRLGKEMDLFHFQPEAHGAVFWHSKGWAVYRALQSYIRSRLESSGYVEVNTPQLVDRVLWEQSGHWGQYREHMFVSESEDRTLAIKPMNCPCHIQIFKQGIKSYRDLPLRMAEFGSCHRNEPSGALHGLMRVRAFTQDDAHIFCTDEQIESETQQFCTLLQGIYADFGFTDIRVKFSDRPEKRAGSDAVWDRAENALKRATVSAGIEASSNPGEGAFYGPKLEFILRDAIGRDWQCGTLQVDYVLPERLDATYVAEDGSRQRPVMLHRAVLGSFERFIGILIENFAGRLPVWLSPVQVVVATITSESDLWAEEVARALRMLGIRVEVDVRNEKINFKVREHSHAKVPFMLVVGRREAEEKTVALRCLGGSAQEILALEDAIAKIKDEAKVPLS